VLALLQFWGTNREWHDTNPALATVCRVWAKIGDPVVVEALTQQALHIPNLFLETVVAFGEEALPPLAGMLLEADPNRRMLAVQALRRLKFPRSFSLLAPLLCDLEPEVRAAVPQALAEVSTPRLAAAEAVRALQDGFSSPEAIGLMQTLDELPFEGLIELVERWNPHSLTVTGDTSASLLAAVPLLGKTIRHRERVFVALCDLLERKPGARLTTEIAKVLGNALAFQRNQRAWDALWELLSHADKGVRSEAAQALSYGGEPFGNQFLGMLERHRPKGNLIHQLQAVLRGGVEASQVANQAVQQVSQWWSRLSKESGEHQSVSEAALAALGDRRVPAMAQHLLENALERLPQARAGEEGDDLLGACVATLRLLGELPPATAREAHGAFVRALYTVKRSEIYEGNSENAFQPSEIREVGNLVRVAAAETLYLVYGARSFALFLEALYANAVEVRRTALFSLSRLGDVRALPHLQNFAKDPLNPLCEAAQEAIAGIKRTNPHLMTLLRPSSPLHVPNDSLLRPAVGTNVATDPNELLRPVQGARNDAPT
jgi:HEAT repeat protein